MDSQAYKAGRPDRKRYELGEGRQFLRTWFLEGEVLLMQTATIQKRIEQLPALSRAGKRINGLHRLMRDCRKIGGAAASWVFSRSFSDRGWMRGLDGEVGEDRG